MKEIKIKYFSDIEEIKKVDNGDWIDLRSAIDIDFKKDEFKLIPLGIGMKLPQGYEAHIPFPPAFTPLSFFLAGCFYIIGNS